MHNVLVNLDKKRIVFSSRAPRGQGSEVRAHRRRSLVELVGLGEQEPDDPQDEDPLQDQVVGRRLRGHGGYFGVL
ncbi:hypothetical protein EYF80_051971 [Liparis tanakae]|uniref:Uncharacterized protein n=1 Tax=Liparis tanakae TaxID=230148 RepID=A0A4Z2F9L8_9TELE|nr:hypothetical protein EYF80_051971 [Liparis tanakae]